MGRARRIAPGALLLGALWLALVPGCGRRQVSLPSPVPSASPATLAAAPLDRLAPGELAPGEQALFGLRLPQGMSIQGKFKDSAVAIGNVPLDSLIQYVRSHVEASHVEVGAAQTIFPSARVLGAANGPPLRIEIKDEAGATRLHVRDMTPVATPKLEGLSNDDLWRRAGFDREGKPLRPKELE